MSLWDLNELGRRLSNIVTLGTVETLEAEQALVTVRVGEIVTEPLPWLALKAGTDSTWWAPDPGEQVLLLSPDGEMNQAVAIAGVYQAKHPAPGNNPNIARVQFEDGCSVQYDKDKHELKVDVNPSGATVVINSAASVTVNTKKAVVNSPKIDLGESSSLEPSVLGDKLADWIKKELKLQFDQHTHVGNLGRPTGPPILPLSEGTAAKGGAIYSKKNRNQ